MNFKTIITFICLIMAFNTFSQKKVKTEFNEPFETAVEKYRNSLRYSDFNTAISAMHDIIIAKPENLNYKDSLLALYFNAGFVQSAVILAQELEKGGNTNPSTFEVLAMSFQNAGLLKESLEYYEKLNKTENNLYYQYQIATIQFNLSRVQECSQTLTTIIQNPEAAKQTIKMDYEKQASQQIPYSAAAYNILGVLSLQLKEDKKAKEHFAAALKISPQFVLAQNNLTVLSKEK